LQARTGEFTPPGMTWQALAKRAAEFWVFMSDFLSLELVQMIPGFAS
jgi:hypothetical protein